MAAIAAWTHLIPPDHLAGLSIPLGARILAVVDDYDTALAGTSFTRPLKPADALLQIQNGKSRRYDPVVVDAFLKMSGGGRAASGNSLELALRTGQLLQGMTLARDLVTQGGDMLLSKGYVLNEQLIDQIHRFERMEGSPLTIYVEAKK